MTDKWSLETLKDDHAAFLEGLFVHEQDGYYFSEKAINTLRQKLIDDIAVYCDSEKVILFDIIDIINKRFGVA